MNFCVPDSQTGGQWENTRIAHLVFLQHHEVEMSDAFLAVLSHTLEEGRLADHVTQIFVDEGVPTAGMS